MSSTNTVGENQIPINCQQQAMKYKIGDILITNKSIIKIIDIYNNIYIFIPIKKIKQSYIVINRRYFMHTISFQTMARELTPLEKVKYL